MTASFPHLHQHCEHVIFARLMSKKLAVLYFYIPFYMNVVVCDVCSFQLDFLRCLFVCMFVCANYVVLAGLKLTV